MYIYTYLYIHTYVYMSILLQSEMHSEGLLISFDFFIVDKIFCHCVAQCSNPEISLKTLKGDFFP